MDNTEVSVDGGLVKGKVTFPSRHLCVAILLFIACGIATIGTMVYQHDQTSEKLSQAVSQLSNAINLMVCISAVPPDERKHEYLNPASNCNFYAKVR